MVDLSIIFIFFFVLFLFSFFTSLIFLRILISISYLASKWWRIHFFSLQNAIPCWRISKNNEWLASIERRSLISDEVILIVGNVHLLHNTTTYVQILPKRFKLSENWKYYSCNLTYRPWVPSIATAAVVELISSWSLCLVKYFTYEHSNSQHFSSSPYPSKPMIASFPDNQSQVISPLLSDSILWIHSV